MFRPKNLLQYTLWLLVEVEGGEVQDIPSYTKLFLTITKSLMNVDWYGVVTILFPTPLNSTYCACNFVQTYYR